jgi:phenylalanyl-tRNA synthetase beta chain
VLVPLSWLREFAPIEGDPDDLAAAFSNLGLVVDGTAVVGGGLDGVVVARVSALRRHPDADKIQLVDVDPGDGGPLQIACGAFNMAVGDLVPLAKVGTVLPNGLEIGRRKMRGEWSNGMLCSAAELGLPDADGEKGILRLASGVAAPGTSLADALAIEPDVVFDLDISPNRPDALSIAGVARDMAAALHVPFSLPSVAVPADPSVERPTIEVLDPDLCPRFTGTALTGIVVAPSPAWVARRLTLCGMRAINNVVDVSNYVMLELGQPNHAYDLDRLPGRGLVVRRARAGETLVTLDGVERSLGPDDCLICDAHSTPVGVAGIMGGASSEISDATSAVLLEVAYFTPMAIARTGKRLGVTTEARSRFERGTDPNMIDLAIDRFASLLPGTARGATVDVRADPYLPSPRHVLVRTERVNAILGTSFTDGAIADLLAPIGFATEAGPEPGVQAVTVPTWRPDSEREIDVIEEVGRLHGYRNIERTLPRGVRAGGGLTGYQKRRREVRSILAGEGVSEAWTTTFLGPGDLERAGLPGAAVEVENPLDRSESLLRTSLIPGLLKALRFNADRQQPDVRLFEIGRVFGLPADGQVVPAEREDLACVVAGESAGAVLATRLWSVLADALRLDGLRLEAAELAGLHPARAARIVAVRADGGGEGAGQCAGGPAVGAAAEIGVVGEIAPEVADAFGLSGRVGVFAVSLEDLLTIVRRRRDQAVPVSRFPASDFDLAFVVPEDVPASDVESTLRRSGGGLLEGIQLFDVYRGPGLGDGRRSLAYHVRLRALDRTLTEADVAAVRRRQIDAVADAHRAELRG